VGYNDVILLIVILAMQAADVASSLVLRLVEDIDLYDLYCNLKIT
jgi:hypothetical protein